MGKFWSNCKWLVGYSKLHSVLTSGWINSLVPFAMAAYLGYLDFFPNESWINEHTTLHYRIYTLGLIGVGVWQVLRSWGDSVRAKSPASSTDTLIELINSVSVIIQAKSKRFRDKLMQLGTKAPFDAITQPLEQLEFISREAHNVFQRLCRVDKRDRFDVTVIWLVNGSWEYAYTYQRNYLRSTEPTQLMRGGSTAKLALDSGAEQFFPSKRNAASAGQYLIGPRDEKIGGDGSVFCKPIHVKTPFGDEQFVLTFTTYGVSVCEPWDSESSQGWQLIFREFARRIELELILLSIKQYRANVNEQARHAKSQKGRSK